MEAETGVSSKQLRIYYIAATVVLLITEVLIALFVKDNFIRPHVGDVLVVILIYTFLRIFFPEKPIWLPVPVLVLAILVEVLQYYHIVQILHLKNSAFFSTLIGGYFDWKDIASYTFGFLMCVGESFAMRYTLFQKKNKEVQDSSYNPGEKKPAIKCSICNGEQVAGFVNLESGAFEDVMLLRNEKDLQEFKKKYGIEGEIEKIY